MEYAFFEGRIVPAEEAKISVKTNSFHYGTSVFEGIRAYYSKQRDELFILFAREHYDRLLKSAAGMMMNIPYSADDLIAITKEVLRKSAFREDVYIRPIIYFKDHKIVPKLLDFTAEIAIAAFPFGKYIDSDKGARVKVSSWQKNSDNAIPNRWKVSGAYVNSALAKTEALLDGYDEAILLNNRGNVAEGSGENIFLVRGGKIITPAVSEGILEGITRQALIDLVRGERIVEVEERGVARSELYLADEIFFSGTAAEITPIVEVDRRKVGGGEAGEITKKIQEKYFKAVRGEFYPYFSHLTAVYKG